MLSIFDEIGKTSLHHCTLVVQSGRIITGVAFFTELLSPRHSEGGWHELKGERSEGPWGESRFVITAEGGVRIQIFEPTSHALEDRLRWVDEDHHVALMVTNPALTAKVIVNYFQQHGAKNARYDELANGRFWVELPEFFVTPIELVPDN